ncbi:MAG: M3 family oligoendopeptidase, partial [Enterococcus sp.]
MLFSEILYQRPDLTQYKTQFYQTNQEFSEAPTYHDAKEALEKLNHLRAEMTKNMKLAYIRHSINTKDEFYRAENDFWDHHSPLVDQIHNQFYESLLSSSYRDQLEKVFSATLFLFAEDQLRLLDDSVIGLKQQENEVISQYTQLIASAELTFKGKKHTL